MTQVIDSSCPLCFTNCATPFMEEVPPQNWAPKWLYFHCETCDLIHRNRSSYLSVREESERYAMHENREQQGAAPPDAGYLRFLSPILEQVKERMPKGSKGLDFGCGPGPLLAQQLSLAGFAMSTYDPQFAPLEAPLLESYNFVTCTEVLEHVKEPKQVLSSLLNLASVLKPSGLFLLTGFHTYQPSNAEALQTFKRWHYRRDPTHICFFSEKTFRYWASENQCAVLFPARNVAVIIPANGTN